MWERRDRVIKKNHFQTNSAGTYSTDLPSAENLFRAYSSGNNYYKFYELSSDNKKADLNLYSMISKYFDIIKNKVDKIIKKYGLDNDSLNKYRGNILSKSFNTLRDTLKKKDDDFGQSIYDQFPEYKKKNNQRTYKYLDDNQKIKTLTDIFFNFGMANSRETAKENINENQVGQQSNIQYIENMSSGKKLILMIHSTEFKNYCRTYEKRFFSTQLYNLLFNTSYQNISSKQKQQGIYMLLYDESNPNVQKVRQQIADEINKKLGLYMPICQEIVKKAFDSIKQNSASVLQQSKNYTRSYNTKKGKISKTITVKKTRFDLQKGKNEIEEAIIKQIKPYLSHYNYSSNAPLIKFDIGWLKFDIQDLSITGSYNFNYKTNKNGEIDEVEQEKLKQTFLLCMNMLISKVQSKQQDYIIQSREGEQIVKCYSFTTSHGTCVYKTPIKTVENDKDIMGYLKIFLQKYYKDLYVLSQKNNISGVIGFFEELSAWSAIYYTEALIRWKTKSQGNPTTVISAFKLNANKNVISDNGRSLGKSNNDIVFKTSQDQLYGMQIKGKLNTTETVIDICPATNIDLLSNNGAMYNYFDEQEIMIMKFFYQNYDFFKLTMNQKHLVDQDIMERLALRMGLQNTDAFLRITTKNYGKDVKNVYYLLNGYIVPTYIILKEYRNSLLNKDVKKQTLFDANFNEPNNWDNIKLRRKTGKDSDKKQQLLKSQRDFIQNSVEINGNRNIKNFLGKGHANGGAYDLNFKGFKVDLKQLNLF